ncbi:MAG: peptidoglycan DD-metalloendopeptidase family protein [Deltaproteobacteria bacterium]|nr:peptidoglycan DD-metalloendopeptidase family protein [Deltaproteobacteria bacterium]
MIRRPFLSSISLSALSAFLLFAWIMPANVAGRDTKGSIEKSRKELQAVERKKDTAKEKVRQSKNREKTILGELEALDRDIGDKKRRVGLLRRKERKLRADIARAEENLRSIAKKREAAKNRLLARSIALYKAGNVSYLKVVLGSSGIDDLTRRLYYLRRVSAYDSNLFHRAADLYHQGQQEENRLLEEKKRLAGTRRDLESDLSVLSRKKRSRGILLASVRNDRKKYSRLISELEASSKRLIKLIEALNQQAETGESAFPMLKGALKRPVSGKIMVGFGKNRNAKFNTFTLSRGITIRSSEGTPVRTVFKGKTLFADWFRGYGRIIILDHGGGYYTLYGHLSAINVKIGQEVDTDEVIGLAGESGSLEGPALYFEIRHHGKPVDPMPWFSGG